MQFFVVDAFTDKLFGGNPAGVVIYDNMDGDKMQMLAAELRFSETAFIKPRDKNRFDIRFFTPNSEVPLCGHATIASFGALLNSKYISSNNSYHMNTKSGMLPVYVNQDFILMEQSAPEAGKMITEIDGIANALKISPNDIGDKDFFLKPQAISTGLFDIILPVKSKEILNSISPNFDKLSALSKLNNVIGVHAFTLDDEDCVARCRNFAPLYGINEEAATGTSNGALTYYLYLNNIIKDFKKDYIFFQGEKMNRPSKIVTRLEFDEHIKILVGGSYKILIQGKLLL
ncbi:MAG: phenazine biosynthesis protein PhzF family [Clostridiales bacterium]|nr:phenazine biosynthesis protein PhzF family [Clostridiales bacterium]